MLKLNSEVYDMFSTEYSIVIPDFPLVAIITPSNTTSTPAAAFVVSLSCLCTHGVAQVTLAGVRQ